MKLCSIASSSGGNCIYVGSNSTHLLIDAGISMKKIEEGLKEIGVKGEDLNGILVTHEHVDHISGLGPFSRKYGIPIYSTKGTHLGIELNKNTGVILEKLFHDVLPDEMFSIGDIDVRPFRISHDAKEPTGFRIESGDKSVAIATDLGVYDSYIIDNLKELDAIVIEANHDTYMVEVGPYPYHLKQRVLGPKGHLSNELTGRLLCNILHDELKYIILGHLSKDNNYDELAKETVKLEVTMGPTSFKGEDLNLLIAERDKVSCIIEV